MKPVMSHQFGNLPQANVQRSVFDLSHGHKTTFDAGNLIPVLAMEIYPGDTFNVSSMSYARLATPIYPIMDNMRMDMHYFFIPLRLVWDNFQKFMGEKVNPTDSTSYVVPVCPTPASTGAVAESLQDYLGVMINVAEKDVCAFYTRAYNRVYNEWYRPEFIVNSAVVDMDNGDDDPADYVVRKRCKYHDYFTSALPWPQRGTAVELPLGTTAPVVGLGFVNPGTPASTGNVLQTGESGYVTYANGRLIDATGGAGGTARLAVDGNSGSYPAIYTNLAEATAATINSLREAFQLQKFYETLARGGERYTEIIRSCFGVISPDARLQRTEFLGGSSSPLMVNAVANTSATATEKQGSLAGYGTISLRSGFTKSFTEHGILLGIMSVRADLTYQQGLHRKFSRQTRADFYWPQFSHLGEQAVLTQELYCDGSAADDDVFGYQERYAELRYEPSRISGKFRSTYSAPLDAWHLSQEFSSAPTLSQTFIEETPPMARIKAVTTEPDFIYDSFHNIRAARALPTWGVPGWIDHL